MNPRTIGWITTTVLLALPLIGLAEDAGVISASGSATLERMPEVMRLRIDIPAAGADVKQALAKLAGKRDAATKKLKDLGVAENAVVWDPPRLAVKSAEEGADAEPDEDSPSKARVLATLKVEWPLKSETAESLLETVHRVQTKVRKADLAGRKGDDAAEEEEERPKNNAIRYALPGYQQPAKPGEARWTFAFKVSEADRAKLLKEAFAQAKAEAETLATAAQVKLGSLAKLSSTAFSVTDDDEWSPYTAQIRALQASQGGVDASPDKEASGNAPRKITYRVSVSVSYGAR